jgi:hypothetical protein
MATEADEFEPPGPVIERVFVEAIVPVLRACESSLGWPIVADLTVWVRDDPRSSLAVTSTGIGSSDPPTSGEIRLRFRRTIDPHRTLFRAEAILPGVRPKKGFSGFTIRGDVRQAGDAITVRDRGGAYRHNVWTWTGW